MNYRVHNNMSADTGKVKKENEEKIVCDEFNRPGIHGKSGINVS